MHCYKDKTYCFASSKHFSKEFGIKYCNNKKCYRHASEIPEVLPPYENIAWCDFSGENCEVKDEM